MSGARWILPLALLASCGQFEEITTPGPLRGEARRNPLLAAERMLTELGLPTTSTDLWPGLLPEDAFIIVSGERFELNGAVLEQFLAWVDQGGHAIVCLSGFDRPVNVARVAMDRPNALINELGLWIFESPTESELREAMEFSEENPFEPAESVSIEYEQMVSHYDDELELLLDPGGSWLSHDGEESLPMQRVYFGEGQLTLIGEGGFLARTEIGDADHAQWLWRECQVGEYRPGRALLIHGGRPTLWTLIKRHTPESPWMLLLLVALALWRVAARFGPRLREPARARLGFDLHVTALGEFLWRRGGRLALVSAWRQRVLRRAQETLHLRSGSDADLSRSTEFAAAISARSGLEATRVQQALTSEHLDQHASFIQVVADLQDIERSL